ncbi:MAG: glycosyltransferase family 4 protein [Terriglobia bacterium]
MTIVYLEHSVPWFGPASGYWLLPKYVQQSTGYRVEVTRNNLTLWQRGLGRLANLALGFNRSSIAAAAELRFRLALARSRSAVGHILSLDDHLEIWPTERKGRLNVVATLHQPPSQWTEPRRRMLRRVEHAIVLYERDLDWFAQVIGPDRVHFLRYGVDTEFFRPGAVQWDSKSEKRILFAGHWLRNTEMLARVVEKVVAYNLPVAFDFLVPSQWRNTAGLTKLLGHPKIRWHANLSDEELLDLYQKSYLLLLPLRDGGGNTAVVEGLACGLPIVTTDKGGTRSYGAGSLYPVVADDDDGAMVDLIMAYLESPKWRDEMSKRSRRFAEEKLSWDITAPQHADLYKRLFA